MGHTMWVVRIFFFPGLNRKKKNRCDTVPRREENDHTPSGESAGSLDSDIPRRITFIHVAASWRALNTAHCLVSLA